MEVIHGAVKAHPAVVEALIGALEIRPCAWRLSMEPVRLTLELLRLSLELYNPGCS
jgi:hypothetical protein